MVRIRQVTIDDASEAARLCGELGYPSTEAQISSRLRHLHTCPDHQVFVADDGSHIVGWLHIGPHLAMESDPMAEVLGLVVADGRRGQGTGRLLMAEAEAWARRTGFAALRVRSNVVRERTHKFYEGLGFRTSKTQKVFDKAV